MEKDVRTAFIKKTKEAILKKATLKKTTAKESNPKRNDRDRNKHTLSSFFSLSCGKTTIFVEFLFEI